MAGKMAAAESNHDHVSCYESAKRNAPIVISHREIECYRFRSLDLIYYLTSVSCFCVDIATDNIISVKYFLQGQFIWGCFALSFTIVPAGIIQIFSLRWYHSDGSIKVIHWLLHVLFLGVLHRYLILLYATIYSLRNKCFVKDKNWVYRQESDICMLHLFESFMGAAPQLILQLYVMAVLKHTPVLTSLSAVASFCSLSWAVGTYTKAMHKINPGHSETTWVALTLQGLWRAGMLISRIAVLVLTAICLREWFILFLGLHWLFMTVWVILQNTDFCPTIWEERIYNCIIGFIYCFDFFNLRVGKSRYRVLIFYSIIVIENIVFVVVYVLCFKDEINSEEIALTTSLIFGGMIIGLTSMLFYYGKYHPSKVDAGGPMDLDRTADITTNETTITSRSFKQYYPNSFASSPRSVDNSQKNTSEETMTDKQFLLTNIVQSSECAENGIVNQSCKIENESKTAICVISEDESAQSHFSKEESASMKNGFSPTDGACECLEIQNDRNDITTEKDLHRQKRRGICLPTTHGLDIDKEASTTKDACLPSQKRRGICFSNQLILEIEDNAERNIPIDKELISDATMERDECSIDDVTDDLNSITVLRDRLKTPTIYNDSCEKVEEKLTKELQQRDETMSCVTSIHDYENVCPLGVARPPWCIRSWKGYTDIETYIHDDSVVRDRRRDTLTSTTTGTTYSSEFSDTTCASSLLRGIFKQDDYLDTLTYDLVDPRESVRPLYTEDASAKKSSAVEEQNATLYIAKPVVIDDRGGMFALDTILEEHDELPVEENFGYNRPSCGSVSTLVSTIDQIRKYTAENSPRHVYHTTGTHWEDFDPKDLIKKAQLAKALFKNEPKDSSNTCNRNYINYIGESTIESDGPEKCEIDTVKDIVKYCTIESIKKTPLIDAILSDSPILGNKGKLQKQQLSSSSSFSDKVELAPKENDLYVEMSPLVSVENVKLVHNNLSNDCTEPVSNNIGSSDCPFRCTDVTSAARSTTKVPSDAEKTEQISERRKKTINYPKRKFFLLKEKFESKSQLVYVVTPNNAIKIEQSAIPTDSDASKRNVSVIVKKTSDFSTKHDKENLAPVVSHKLNHSKYTPSERFHTNREAIDSTYENDKSSCNTNLNLKERRHIFLEQVLSPPKLLAWNKRKSFNGSTAIKKL